MSPLQACEAIIEGRLIDPQARAFFSGLPTDERHYWIASLYALLMPPAKRRRLAAYFTPPHLAQHAIDLLASAGIRPGEHRILDPASGGAAFLVPLAEKIAQDVRRRGTRARELLETINSTLHGVEIDAGLADLSRALLKHLFSEDIKATGIEVSSLVERANTLELTPPKNLYDAVIGNPPYGRILRPAASLRARYSTVIAGGYVNLYSLFVEQALRHVRPGGVVCLILPSSFIGGPYFARLRKRILQKASVLRLDLIDKRNDVFVDVLYDLCVLLVRRKGGNAQVPRPRSYLLPLDSPCRDLGFLELPEKPSTRVWALPDKRDPGALFQPGLTTLKDYGYVVKTGYFVWNREKDRYRIGHKPRPTEVPLFWAHNIHANAACQPDDGKKNSIGFVKISDKSSAIVRSDAILLQRTSNRGQRRRLIAGVVRQSKIPGERGFVTENHTIVVTPQSATSKKLSIGMLCKLLNTAAVDARFRRMSGSVSVSTIALRDLPLPQPSDVRSAFRKRRQTDDEAAEAAYALSLSRKRKSKQVGRNKSQKRGRR